MTELDFRGARSTQAPSAIERLIPLSRRRERAQVDLAASPVTVWRIIRHGDLARTSLLRALFRICALIDPSSGVRSDHRFGIDALRSTLERPGFLILADEPPLQLAVGALVRVRKFGSAFVHASGAREFTAFDQPGVVKLAWSAHLSPLGIDHCRLRFETRVGATDERAWRTARWPLACVAPGVNWAQRQLLGSLADELGWPEMAPAHAATRVGAIAGAAAR